MDRKCHAGWNFEPSYHHSIVKTLAVLGRPGGHAELPAMRRRSTLLCCLSEIGSSTFHCC
jgi:hypothetical protein